MNIKAETPILAHLSAGEVASGELVSLAEAEELLCKARSKIAARVPELCYTPTQTEEVMDSIRRFGNHNEMGGELGDEDWP